MRGEWERSLIYIDVGTSTIRILDLDTRETQVWATVQLDTLWPNLDVSPDGKWIVYTHLDRAGSDIILVDPASF